MGNYLEEIEAEYSRIRGKWSMLNPLDWQLAESWEKSEIPLSIVLRAMSETWRNFEANKRNGSINSLRYFEPEVKKQHTEYLQSQVGKHTNDTIDMNNNFADTLTLSDDQAGYIENNLLNVFDLDYFERYSSINLSELLKTAIKKVRSELIILIEDIRSKQLSLDEIESRLEAISNEFDISLIANSTDDERAEIISQTKAEYGKFNLTPELLQKMLIRKLYRKFNLPELTLFAL